MNKSNLRKMAYKLNSELNGNIKAFIFLACIKYLSVHKILNKENWVKNFIKFDDKNIDINGLLHIFDNYDEEFENIESIGWLYQYFISDEKIRVFNNLKNNIKVEKDDIPYATRSVYTRLDC